MAEAAVQSRIPELEVYGRSLSTIYRFGAYMVDKSRAQIITSPEAAQARAEFYTSVEEGFGTDMELGGGLEVRDFDTRAVIDGKVMSKDLKTAVSDMTRDGLTCAEETAKKDRRFLPQLKRSKWDHDNALTVDKMVREETAYNTRIVVSPFPEEAAAQSGDKYWRDIGYVPHLKRGFVQLYHVTDQGLVAGSLSFDGSNKQKLREVFGGLGVEIPEDEVTDNWLQYAITATLSGDQAKQFVTELADELSDSGQKKTTNTVDVTREYGHVMDAAFDESYVHICESIFRGHQTPAMTGLVHQFANKAHHFNKRYGDSLYKMRANTHEFSDADAAVMHELLVYSTIEMMRALHLKTIGLEQKQLTTLSYMQTLMDPSVFQNMLSVFGADGARNNRTYSACGLSISLGDMLKSDSPQSSFGGNGDRPGDEETSGKKSMSCPFCKAKVYDDPCAKVLCCWDCKAKVVDGKVVSQGNGGSKARLAARKQHEAEIAKSEHEPSAEADELPSESEEKAHATQKVAQLALSTAGV